MAPICSHLLPSQHFRSLPRSIQLPVPQAKPSTKSPFLLWRHVADKTVPFETESGFIEMVRMASMFSGKRHTTTGNAVRPSSSGGQSDLAFEQQPDFCFHSRVSRPATFTDGAGLYSKGQQPGPVQVRNLLAARYRRSIAAVWRRPALPGLRGELA